MKATTIGDMANYNQNTSPWSVTTVDSPGTTSNSAGTNGASVPNAGTNTAGTGASSSTTTSSTGTPSTTSGSSAGTFDLSTLPGWATASSAQQQTASDILQNYLGQYGLSSLAPWAWQMITQGATGAQVETQLYNQPAFQQRFPGIGIRQQSGLPPISPTDYISYENSFKQLMQSAGMPQGFYDSPEAIGQFIGQDISPSELTWRIQQGYQAAMQAPQEVRDQLQNLYGVGMGGIAAYFLDPHAAQATLETQFQAAQIAGMSEMTGYGQINRNQAERLAQEGITTQQAQSGFNTLAKDQQIFNPLPGEKGAGIDQQTQMAAQFDQNAAAQLAVQRATLQRMSPYQGGGRALSTQTGVSGLGQATQA